MKIFSNNRNAYTGCGEGCERDAHRPGDYRHELHVPTGLLFGHAQPSGAAGLELSHERSEVGNGKGIFKKVQYRAARNGIELRPLQA